MREGKKGQIGHAPLSEAREKDMTKVSLVTGAAGFLGSHLSEALLQGGYRVIGLDSFTEYYSKGLKRRNLLRLTHRNFKFVKGDLATCKLGSLLKRVDYVFHFAAQPGVRDSWGETFSSYVHNNIVATETLLRAASKSHIERLIFASSSSVYGSSLQLPTPEEAPTVPISPYGITKLSSELLCRAYSRTFGVPIVILRFFTAYGPRQRPDMAFHRFISDISNGRRIVVYGDGKQSRDFTFVKDAVRAASLAINAPVDSVLNVGTGVSTSVNVVVELIESLTGYTAKLEHREAPPGEARNTCADISRAKSTLGYSPQTTLRDGLRAQIDWQLKGRG